jgi:hypothetical protein
MLNAAGLLFLVGRPMRSNPSREEIELDPITASTEPEWMIGVKPR